MFILLNVLLDADVAKVKEKFPSLDESLILDLKVQFQTFDLNQDGVIDFREL